MKTFYLSIFLLLTMSLSAQDTTIVQTLTFDSTGRDYVFNFPTNTGKTYEKVLMEYRMRCKGGLVSTQSNRNLGCGEWDYSCNTYITDSTAIDSSKATHPSHLITGFSGSNTYNYTNQPTYTYFRSTQKKVTYTATTSETVATINTGSNSSGYPFDNSTGQAKVQYLVTAAELTSGGIITGNITGLRLDLNSLGDQLKNLRIKIKATSSTQLDPAKPEVQNFTTVYYLNTTLTSTGSNQFNFSNPFNWNGTSNIIVEFSFDQSQGNSSNVKSSTNNNYGLATKSADYSIEFSGSESVKVDNAFPSISNEITISFWQFGNADIMPKNSSLFEGVDNNNKRQALAHLPWGNSRVYWDCGNDGSGYDRIDKAANPSNFEGQWNHWAFTKNATTGSMKIYLNGTLWHSGTGKTKSIDLKSLSIGRALTFNNGYYGKIDEFQVWNKELSGTQIADYMYKKVTSSHPNFSNLMLYYQFNTGSGNSVTDATGQHAGTLLNNPLWRAKKGKDLFLEFSTVNERPNMEILQGVYTTSVVDFVVLDSTINAPNTIRKYSVSNNDLSLDNTYTKYEAGYMPVYDENGTKVDSVLVTTDGTINITTLDYYKKEPSKFEIMSFVTPYGIGLNLGPKGKVWTFDVTDFTPILKGKKRLTMERGGQYQEEMDIRFLFISGTPPRNVLDIKQIWKAESRGYQDIMSNKYFEPKNVPLSSSASMFKIRTVITGHGQQGEFISRTHYLNVNGGPKELSWNVWTECADNPIFPQGGTWIYDRAGWCPGAPSDLKELDITKLVTPGQSVEIDYGVVTASGHSNYIVNNQLVSYGAANFTLDARVEEIKRPSQKIEYDRVNPICHDPIIRIRNTGSTKLTSLKITYYVEGRTPSVYNWSGDLEFMEAEEVTLPVTDPNFWVGGGKSIFHVKVSEPNGGNDEYAQNDSMSSTFVLPDVYKPNFIISLRTNNLASQNSYRIRGMDGNIVYFKGNLTNNTTYNDTIKLPEGCYTFELDDTGNDGLSFWANSAQGSGFLRFNSHSPFAILKNFIPDFGKSIVYSFSIGKITNVEEVELNPTFEIYPNPSNGLVYVDLSRETYSNNAQIIINDMMGRVVKILSMNDFKSGTLSFDLSNESNGVYFLSIISDEKKQTKKFILNK